MRCRGSGLAAAALLALGWFGSEDVAGPGSDERLAGQRASGCIVCHPGAVDGLRASVHSAILDRYDDQNSACVDCHGEQDVHVASARRPEDQLIRPPPVEPERCAVCHGTADWPTRSAAHPFVRREDRRRASLDDRVPIEVPPLPAEAGLGAFEWDALVTVGYRFVSTIGSLDGYDTDVDLHPGFRVIEGGVTGSGQSALLDRIDLHAHDLGDPYAAADAEIAKEDVYRASADFTQRASEFRVHGDYSKVEHVARSTSIDLSVDLSEDVDVYVGYAHFRDREQWLTYRIGGRGVSSLQSIDDVRSPRELDSDAFSVGLRGVAGDTRFLVGVEYLDQDLAQQWSYSRPAPGNPAVIESEDFRSDSTVSGPGFLASVGRDFGDVHVDLDGRFRTLERNVDGAGARSGFDNTAFETTTASSSDGDARTLWLGADVTAELGGGAALLLDLRYRDHREEMRLMQVDVTRFLDDGSSVIVQDQRTQITEQQRLSGALELELEVADGLTLSGGWGFSHEDLTLPDVVAGDTDPTGGSVRQNGAIFGARWRIDDRWTVRGRISAFGQSGLQLYEPQPDESRSAEASVRYRSQTSAVEVFGRHRRAENDGSSFQSRWTSVGISGSWLPSDRVELFGSYVFTDIQSSTLTNFYFDPDPAPVPTVVGFDGATHVIAASLGVRPVRRLRWRNDFAVTSTTGSFDVQTVNWSSDLSWEVLERASLGARYRLIDYRDAGGTDDYNASLVMVYWSQRFGGAGR